MLRKYSSLNPRTASLSHKATTIRSQNTPWDSPLYKAVENSPSDATVDSGSSSLNPGFGNEITSPAARLLAPHFGPSVDTTEVNNVAAGGEVEVAVSAAVVAPNGSQRQQSGGHSIGFTADTVRKFMNDESRNSMSEGTLLDGKKAQWEILSETRQPVMNTIDNHPEQNPFTTAAYDAGTESSITADAGNAWNSNEVLPENSASAETVHMHPEPSMLDRLKEFYGPDGESSARQIWKRNFQKLQSPFNVFRDREKTPQQIVTPPAVQQIDPFSEQAVTATNGRASEPGPVLLQLIKELNHELENWPQQLNGRPRNLAGFQRRQQDLQLLYLIANQPSEAIASLDTLPDGEQAFWQELMLAMAQYRTDDEITQEQRLSSTAEQLRSATRHLTIFGDLNFRRLDICSRIFSFGRVEAFPSNDFDPGQPILLYTELENFSTEITARGAYRTNFDAQLQILHDNSNEPIETIDLADISDESTSERTDYFQSFELTVPSHLATGSYQIRVRLRDRIGRKSAEGFVAFQVR